MKKAIVLIIALVVLPLNFAHAAPAGAGQEELRAQLEQARAQKRLELQTILLQAELMREALHSPNRAPVPIASVDSETGQPAPDQKADPMG